MKIIHCEQGSEEWMKARLGVVTASCFHKIVKADGELRAIKSGRLALVAFDYLAELCTDWALGLPCDETSTTWMRRGTDLEAEARRWYVFETDAELEQVGFVVNDAETVGCSPDGLVGIGGGLEIKNPSAKKHTRYLLRPDELVADHREQVQGAIWVTGRAWWDLLAYSPASAEKDRAIEPLVVRCERDGEYIAKLAESVDAFLVQLDGAMIHLELREPHDG